jgi:hypothetical protein
VRVIETLHNMSNMMKSGEVLWFIAGLVAPSCGIEQILRGIRIKILEKTNECGNQIYWISFQVMIRLS